MSKDDPELGVPGKGKVAIVGMGTDMKASIDMALGKDKTVLITGSKEALQQIEILNQEDKDIIKKAMGNVVSKNKEKLSRQVQVKTIRTGGQIPVMPKLTHTGPVHKGNVVENCEFKIIKDDKSYTVYADVVYGTQKAKMKKGELLANQICTYVKFHSHEHLADSGYFEVNMATQAEILATRPQQ